MTRTMCLPDMSKVTVVQTVSVAIFGGTVAISDFFINLRFFFSISEHFVPTLD